MKYYKTIDKHNKRVTIWTIEEGDELNKLQFTSICTNEYGANVITQPEFECKEMIPFGIITEGSESVEIKEHEYEFIREEILYILTCAQNTHNLFL